MLPEDYYCYRVPIVLIYPLQLNLDVWKEQKTVSLNEGLLYFCDCNEGMTCL